MAKSDRESEVHVLALLDAARQAHSQGLLEQAVQLQREAVEIARTLNARYPRSPNHRRAIASAQYSMGTLMLDRRDWAGAIAALDESEQLYRELGAEGVLNASPLVADVIARRSLARRGEGAGATAVAEIDEAVMMYEELAAAGDSDDTVEDDLGDDFDDDLASAGEYDNDLARIQAINARILYRFGDPDLAVAAADRAIRAWLRRRPSATQFAIAADEANNLVWACIVASSVHAHYGRDDVSLFAAELGVPMLARLVARADIGALADEIVGVTERYAGMSEAERRRAATGYATRFRELVWPGERHDLGPTLADVLADAAPDLLESLTKPPLECLVATPSQRCGSADEAARKADLLAGVALKLLPTRTAAGRRAGLEAHWLFAAASSHRSMAMRYQFDVYGRSWARLLLALVDSFESDDSAIALDLASWADGAAIQLFPHALIAPGLADLARRCVRRHSELLLATGHPEAAEARLAFLATLPSL